MADLSQLFQYAPGTAAAFLGGQQALDDQTNVLHQQELQHLISARDQTQQFEAQKQPGELEKLRLGNVNQDLKNQTDDLANIFTRETQPGKIGATNNENAAKSYAVIAQHLGSLSTAIQDNPNVPPHAAMAQALKGTGMPDKAVDLFMQRYSNVPPAELSQRLQADAQRVLRESPQYAQAYDPAELHANATVFSGANHNATLERMNDANIAAGRYTYHGKPALDEDQQIDAAKTPVERYSLLLDAVRKAQLRGDTERAQHLAARAAFQKNLASSTIAAPNKPPTTDTGTLTGLPQIEPPTIEPPGLPTAPYNAQPPSNVGRGVPGRDFFPGIPDASVKKFQSSDPNSKVTVNGQTKSLAEWFDEKYGAGAAAAVLRAKQ
jgi:hypothetical protein